MFITILKDYVIDHKNKKIYTLDKGKDPNRNAKGIIEIEILNPDGSIDQEARAENCLTLGAITEAFYFAMMNPNSATDPSCLPLSNFGAVFLTDYTGAEDPANSEIQGNIVGFANARVPVSSANPHQGSIDSYYSYIDYKQKEAKFAFSFGSTQANGTFRSIFWGAGREVEGDSNNSPEGLAYAPRIVEKFDSNIQADWTVVANDKGDIFALDGTNIYKYKLQLHGLKKTLALQSTTAMSPVYVPNGAMFNSATGEIIVQKSTTSYMAKYDRDMNYIADVPRLTNLVYYSTEHHNKFAYYNQKIYAIGIQAKNAIYQYNWDYAYEKTFTGIMDASYYNPQGLWSDGKYLYAYYTDSSQNAFIETFKQDPTTGDLVRVCRNQTSQTTLTYDFRCSLIGYIDGYILSSNGFFSKSMNKVGAQSLLASPIVKGSGQTINVKYSFSFK